MSTEQMRAVRMLRWGAPPALVEIPKPEPRGAEVLLRVDAAGLCRSDLAVMDWPEGVVAYPMPFTLGHETAGTVAALGPDAAGVAVGERVIVYARWGCGACWHCASGRENACPHTADRAHGAGLGADGGLADYMVVPAARYLVPIGDLDPARAAPLTDAALTPYHAIKQSLPQLRPGSAAVVIGAGGLGHVAVQILRAITPARIIVVDVRETARALALAAGAHVALPAAGLTAADLRAEAGPEGAMVVLDFVATDETLALAAGSVAQGGDLTYVGRGGGKLVVAPGSLPFECTVRMPTWGTLAELAEVVELARAGSLHAEVELHPLEDALAAYARLAGNQVIGRAVVTP